MRVDFGCAAWLLGAALCSGTVAAADGMRVYDPADLTRDRYQIVARLWVDAWRSAFQVPTHTGRAAAVAALKTEAAQRGANGLLNLACVEDDKPFWGSDRHFCYALAIKVK